MRFTRAHEAARGDDIPGSYKCEPQIPTVDRARRKMAKQVHGVICFWMEHRATAVAGAVDILIRSTGDVLNECVRTTSKGRACMNIEIVALMAYPWGLDCHLS